MRKISVALTLALLVLVAMPSAAQEAGANISKVVFFHAKPGMEEQMKAGLKSHFAWHKSQNDTWTWSTWVNLTGDRTGGYGSATFGHKWEDFDNPPVSEDADNADLGKNVAPYAEVESVRYYTFLSDVSHPSAQSPAMTEVVFTLHPGRTGDFMYLIKKFHDAILKSEWPVHFSWLTLINGGDAPEFVLLLPRPNYASFKPLDKPFPAVLEETYGRQEAQALLEQLGEVTKSQNSSLSRTLPRTQLLPVWRLSRITERG